MIEDQTKKLLLGSSAGKMEHRTSIKAASAATSYGESNANPDGNSEVAIALRQEIRDGNNAATRNSSKNDGPQAPQHGVVLRGSTPRCTCAVCGAVWVVGAMANGCHNCGRGERGKARRALIRER